MTEYALLSTLSPQQRRQVDGLLTSRHVRAGETVVRRGEPGDALYLVERGELEVLSEEGGVRLTTIGAGEDFGSVALLSDAPRSASVRALSDADLRVLSVDHLRALSAEVTDSAYVALLRNMLVTQGADLRRSSDNLVRSLRQQLEDARKRLAMGSILGGAIFIMCVYSFALRDSIVLTGRTGSSTPASVALIVFYVLTMYAVIRRSGYPLSTYGLTRSGWRRSVRESLLCSAVIAGGYLLGKWIAIHWALGWEGESLIQPVPLTREVGIGLAFYALFAPFQEFVARGVLQSSFQEFLIGRWVTARAILYSTMMFSTTHLHMSMAFAVLVLIPSVIWGMLYARHRTLIGVSLSHIIVGVVVFFVIGVPGIG